MKRAFVITALIMGVLLALQVRSYRQVEPFIRRSKPEDMLAELRVFQIANEQLQAHIVEAKKNLDATKGALSNTPIEEEIERLRLLSGEVAVQGEGIEVSLNKAVDAFWVSDLVAQLVTVGAEAVALNDVRLVSKTAGFRSVGGGLVMRRTFFAPPLRFTVIGPSQALEDAISQNGGIINRIERAHPGIAIQVIQKNVAVIPALAGN